MVVRCILSQGKSGDYQKTQMTDSTKKNKKEPQKDNLPTEGKSTSLPSSRDFFSAFDVSLDAILDQGITSLSKHKPADLPGSSITAAMTTIHLEQGDILRDSQSSEMEAPVFASTPQDDPVASLQDKTELPPSSTRPDDDKQQPVLLMEPTVVKATPPIALFMSTIHLGADDILSQESNEDLPIPKAVTLASEPARSDEQPLQQHKESQAEPTALESTQTPQHPAAGDPGSTIPSMEAMVAVSSPSNPTHPAIQSAPEPAMDASISEVRESQHEKPPMALELELPEDSTHTTHSSHAQTQVPESAASTASSPSFFPPPHSLSFSELPVDDEILLQAKEESKAASTTKQKNPETLTLGRSSPIALVESPLTKTQQILVADTQQVHREQVEVLVVRGYGSSSSLPAASKSDTQAVAIADIEAAVAHKQQTIAAEPKPDSLLHTDAADTQNVSVADIAKAVEQHTKTSGGADSLSASLHRADSLAAGATLQIPKHDIMESLQQKLPDISELQSSSMLAAASIAHVGIQTTLQLPLHEVQAIAKAREEGLDPKGMPSLVHAEALALPEKQHAMVVGSGNSFFDLNRNERTEPRPIQASQPLATHTEQVVPPLGESAGGGVDIQISSSTPLFPSLVLDTAEPEKVSSMSSLSWTGLPESRSKERSQTGENPNVKFLSKQLSRASQAELLTSPSSETHEPYVPPTTKTPSGTYTSRIVRTKSGSTQLVVFLLALLCLLAFLALAGFWFFVP